jgi:hypothetical protein
MNIILNINDLCDPDNATEISKNKLHFLDKKRNIIMDGEFTKIVFSDEFITINGVYINCPILFQTIGDRNLLNKNIVYFQPYNAVNTPLLKIYTEMEKQILDYYKEFYDSTKMPVYSLHNQLYSGNAKVYRSFQSTDQVNVPPGFPPHPKKYVIKISGIWETDRNIGITYKFLEFRRVNNWISLLM